MSETGLFDLPRPTRIDCARLVVQFEQQLAEPPAADHPAVVARARRARLGILMSSASLAETGMRMIRERYGSFPRPPEAPAH